MKYGIDTQNAFGGALVGGRCAPKYDHGVWFANLAVVNSNITCKSAR